MINRFQLNRAFLAFALAVVASVVPVAGSADALPSGERVLGNASIEPAYDDFNGSIVYLLTPNRLAPLGANNPINTVNSHAVAPLYLIVYPPGTPGVFNCMGAPGNCPDHGGVIAGVATAVRPDVYGTDPSLVPGHDHLVGMPRTGDFNVPWHVYVELFTGATVTHITTLAQLQRAWTSGAIQELDTGITFACSVVSSSAYMAGRPA
ncbi:MAG TPA: hypothetical protein VK606_00880 [Verrucomicrobiae bacterium]|jgi:hypothetical protein|nr:hypothetical protein [Verrucomicrobiae bacterium]